MTVRGVVVMDGFLFAGDTVDRTHFPGGIPSSIRVKIILEELIVSACHS